MPSRLSPDLTSPHARSVLVAHASAPVCATLLAGLRDTPGGGLHALAWLESLSAAPDLLYAQCYGDDSTPLDRSWRPRANAATDAASLPAHPRRGVRSAASARLRRGDPAGDP